MDWLEPIYIHREFSNAYYVAMLFIVILALYVARRERFWRFSLYLYAVPAFICLVWEAVLFAIGSRTYTGGEAWAVLELMYHALTEAGPGLILMMVIGHKLKIIDLEEFKDDN